MLRPMAKYVTTPFGSTCPMTRLKVDDDKLPAVPTLVLKQGNRSDAPSAARVIPAILGDEGTFTHDMVPVPTLVGAVGNRMDCRNTSAPLGLAIINSSR